MKSFLFYTGVIWSSCILESVFIHFPLSHIRVDLLWLLVLSVGFRMSLFPGGFYVLGLAWIQESFGVPFHGLKGLSYITIYLLLRAGKSRVFFEVGPALVLWVVVLTLLERVCEMGLLFWQGYETSWNIVVLLLTAFLNGFVALLFFPFLESQGRSHVSS